MFTITTSRAVTAVTQLTTRSTLPTQEERSITSNKKMNAPTVFTVGVDFYASREIVVDRLHHQQVRIHSLSTIHLFANVSNASDIKSKSTE